MEGKISGNMAGIHHIGIWVKDLEGMKIFYTRYFNAVAGEKYVNVKKQFASYFLTFENSSIELMNRPDIADPATSDEYIGWAHVAISLGSQDRVLECFHRIRKDGFRILGEPRITGDGFFEAVIADPEGNRIELTV